MKWRDGLSRRSTCIHAVLKLSVGTHTLLMNFTATNVAIATNAEQTNRMLLYRVDSALLHPNSSRLSGEISLHTQRVVAVYD